jgi:hypothetical protein
MNAVHQNPKYNGTHACPECGAKSHWTLVSETPVRIRIECDGECGSFEKSFSDLESMPFFDKPIQKPARSALR